MYPLCNIHHFTFALVILLDIIRTNGSLNNITDTMGFQWTSVPTHIASCKGQDVIFNWSYKIGEYAIVDRSWYKGPGDNAKRIANWNQVQGFITEAKFKDRVERIGEDGLLLKSVTPKDDNTYTLIVVTGQLSSKDPKQNITLTVYEPPLEGCCRPTLHRLNNGTGRQADLNLQACGTQPIDFKWDSLAGVSTNGSIANFESDNVSGTIRVCVTGIAVQKCYKGDPTSLCQEEYIEKISTKEQNMMLIITVSVLVTVVILTVAVILVVCLCKRKLLKCAVKDDAKTMDEQLPLTDTEQFMNYASCILYMTYKTSKELALDEVSEFQFENIELNVCGKVKPNPTYKECLYHKGNPRKLLVIEGYSGSGKKTWCRRFLKTWCTSFDHSKNSGNNANQSNQDKEIEDIKTLGAFPLLFFVSLRDVETGQSPMDIIQQQCLQKQDLSNRLESLIIDRHEDTIFVIHGADEARGDISILNEILELNCLTIIICYDWTLIENIIQSNQIEPVAFIHFKKIGSEKVGKYAEKVFSDLHYPKNSYKEFKKLVKKNNLKHLMQEAFFVQPLFHILHQCNTLPSDIAGVCLIFIQENLKKSREKLNLLPDLKLDFEAVVSFIPRAQGMIFIVTYGKVLKGLGKTAYCYLEKKESKNIFSEEDLMTNTNESNTGLADICIAAKLVSLAPVGDIERQKRLSFCHPIIQNFMAAFYLACEPEEKGISFRNTEIQDLQEDLKKKLVT